MSIFVTTDQGNLVEPGPDLASLLHGSSFEQLAQMSLHQMPVPLLDDMGPLGADLVTVEPWKANQFGEIPEDTATLLKVAAGGVGAYVGWEGTKDPLVATLAGVIGFLLSPGWGLAIAVGAAMLQKKGYMPQR